MHYKRPRMQNCCISQENLFAMAHVEVIRLLYGSLPYSSEPAIITKITGECQINFQRLEIFHTGGKNSVT